MEQTLKGAAKRHAKPFKLLTVALISVHITTSVLRMLAYENTDFTETNLIFGFFEFVDREWNKAPILNIRVTRDQCAEAAFERTWHGTKAFSIRKRSGKKGKGGGVVNITPTAAKSSSIFTDDVRFCKEGPEEPYS